MQAAHSDLGGVGPLVLKLPTWKPIELYTAAVVLPSYGSASDRTSRLRWSITDPASMDAPACALSSR